MAPHRTMALVAAVIAALAAAAVGKAAPARPSQPTEGVLPGQLLTAWGEDLTAIQERLMSTPGVAAKIFNGEAQEILRRNETSLWLTMRDGVRLWTVVSVPEGATQVATVLERTPYFTIIGGPAAKKWNERGFAYVIQDQRGSGRSRAEDDYKFWRYCGQDGYDTMEWIAAQPWSNGQVFVLGASAMGNAAFASGLYEPQWLTAIAPTIATGFGHATTFPNGGYRRALVTNWLTVLGFRDVIDEIFQHEGFDEWWDPIDLGNKADRCHFPGVTMGGWWDIFGLENIESFEKFHYEATDPACELKLIMVPGGHCLPREVSWPDAGTSIYDDITTYLFLRESGATIPPELEARVNEADTITFYVMGADATTVGNYWTTLPAWPTATHTNFYLTPNGTLSRTAPTSASITPLTYTYDPSNPIETIGGAELFLPCGPRDNNELLGRDDILWFTLPAFTENTAVVGELTATLWVSTDRNDTDFMVKLFDVYPDGRSMLFHDGMMRLRWRNGGETPELAVPGTVYELNIKIWRTAYIFEPGHALRVAIQSSNEPRYTVNPNNGLAIGEEGPLLVARNTVYLDVNRPSHVTLPIVPLSSLPHNFTP